MLQRQSNSLAVRAASLADELSDKSALVDALQQDRTRLERELAQSRSTPATTDEGQPNGDDVTDQPSGNPIAAKEAFDFKKSGGPKLSLPVPEGDDNAAGVRKADDHAAATALEAALTAGNVAAAVEEAETNARAAVSAAEARSLALQEMVDSLVAEKVGWEEERAKDAAATLRLRARVRGLEEAIVDHAGGGGGVSGKQELSLAGGLRKLLRERTRELEVTSVATERLGESW